MIQTGTMKKYYKYLMMLLLMLSACGTKNETPQELFLTPPAMSVTVTRDNCPSMEVQVGTEVAWINGDTVTIPIRLEELDNKGNVLSIGKSEINSENIFSARFDHPATYHLYCSENRDVYATITVK